MWRPEAQTVHIKNDLFTPLMNVVEAAPPVDAGWLRDQPGFILAAGEASGKPVYLGKGLSMTEGDH